MTLKEKKVKAFIAVTQRLNDEMGISFTQQYERAGLVKNKYYSVKARNEEPGEQVISAMDSAFPGFRQEYEGMVNAEQMWSDGSISSELAALREAMEDRADTKMAGIVRENSALLKENAALLKAVSALEGQIELLKRQLSDCEKKSL